ncbi:hypothetical protein [Pseudohalioglobus lutimaris]|uniref:Uncharacterized protein n=1 Tax=Pseudohalioglobus lutimaris TaxID=1737061 RepID=A0A2N5WY03_9GAMM|nr:hypothetical protein [Pseudohalioglobus lutimaris]PLW67119.1 hypothetical protein C0039_18570 [Pseudohalioglobus lutimaris]
MIKNTALTDEEKVLMAQYNIEAETRTIFYSEGYKYDKLKDALRYARSSIERRQADASAQEATPT